MKITDPMRVEFLEYLTFTGNLTIAAGKIGVSRAAIYKLRVRDPHFDESCDVAMYRYRADVAKIDATVVDSRAE